MKLYNTLTRQIDQITPLQPPLVTVYTCGPTVYDYAHIGHWFNYVRMDTLIRVLQATGHKTKWVMNITDVGHLVSDADDGEDKLEKGARREGKTAWQVAEFFTEDFMSGMKSLNLLTPDFITKATDHIPEQIALVQTLTEKGYTYQIDDGIYYDTSKFEGYASFAALDLTEQQASGRVAVNSQKRNASDFAVWKFSPAGSQRDMEWDSSFGQGRKGFPGWHIECSAMSMKYLGDTLDIHTGGIDHIPVHHTNEIAQSEAATGKRFANHWMHGNHVTVNGEKVSKSLGNGVRLQEIMERGYTADAIRLNILESHYRSQSKFSWESLEASKNRLQHWLAVAALVWQPQNQTLADDAVASEVSWAAEDIASSLANDLNTPEVLSRIDKLLPVIENNLLSEQLIAPCKAFFEYVSRVLGIDLLAAGPLPKEVSVLLEKRSQARLDKDWSASDTIRADIEALGYGLNDLPSGTTVWHRL